MNLQKVHLQEEINYLNSEIFNMYNSMKIDIEPSLVFSYANTIQSEIDKFTRKRLECINELKKYYDSEVEFYQTEYGNSEKFGFYHQNGFIVRCTEYSEYYSCTGILPKTKEIVKDIFKYIQPNYDLNESHSLDATNIDFISKSCFIRLTKLKDSEKYIIDSSTNPKLITVNDFESAYTLVHLLFKELG